MAKRAISKEEQNLINELAKLRQQRLTSEMTDVEKSLIQDVTKVNIADILSSSRRTECVLARSILFQYWRKQGYTVVSMAERVGRDHTSVLHALKMHKSYLTNFPLYNYWWESYIARMEAS